MENLFFFPTADKGMLEEAGCYSNGYKFSYEIDGVNYALKAKGKNVVKLEDALESWKIEEDGLKMSTCITVEYPQMLKGENGVACDDAEVGICIIWNNRALTQMGYIMPSNVLKRGNAEISMFEYEFPAGEIKSDLTLETVLYLKKAADRVREEERHLINEAGVTLGVIDSVVLNFESMYMDFPIKEIKDGKYPLWWLELNQWEDPRADAFTEDHVCLYLNSYYSYCPRVGESIKNVELLVEIISTAYLMILKKIEEMDCLNETLNNSTNLELGSISKVMYYFYSSCNVPLKFDSIDSLQKTIRQNIEKMLKGDNESDTI